MSLTAEQEGLRDAVRGLLASAGDEGLGWWRRLCERSAWPGSRFPSGTAAPGAGPAEIGVVMEELGRDLTCSPMLGSAVLAAQALLGTGDEAACERLLPAIADGSATAALAWTTRAGCWDTGEVACHAGEAAEAGSWTARRTTCWTATPPTCCWSPPRPGRHRAVRGGPAPGRGEPDGQHDHGPDPAAGDGAADRGAAAAGRRGRGRSRWPAPGTWPASR